MSDFVSKRTINYKNGNYLKILRSKNDKSAVYFYYNKNGERHRDNGPAYIAYNRNGTKDIIKYIKNNVLHREDGPAFLNYDCYGYLFEKRYYKDDKIHRVNGPAFIAYDEFVNKICEEYHKNGVLHRDDGPALITYFNDDINKILYYFNVMEKPTRKKKWFLFLLVKILNLIFSKKITKEEYYLNGLLHRKNGPAFFLYNDEGGLFEVEYAQNGEWYREDGGPTKIKYYNNGNIMIERYHKDGKMHRINGPSVIVYDEEGNIINKEYFINGSKVKPEKIPFSLDKELTEEEKTYLQMKFG